MTGMLISVITFGHLGDKFGRRPIIFIGIVIELLAGFSCAFSVSIEHFIVSRFFLAVGQTGRWATGFVLSE